MMKQSSKILASLVTLAALAGACSPTITVGCGGDDTTCPDPVGLGSGKLVRDLTDADREAWCAWFTDSYTTDMVVTERGPQNPELNPDGSLNCGSLGCSAAMSPELALCMPFMTLDECKRSLAARPCEATMRALDDCARMLLEVDASSHEAPVQGSNPCEESRCAAYFAATNCDGVVLARGKQDPLSPPGAGEPVCTFLVQ
jgi:hypothetical protein